MYRCRKFGIYELVPPHVYKECGEKAWELLDWRALYTLDRLQKRYGTATVNNYKWGGNSKWSGLRTPDSPNYRPYSQHTFGRAFDVKFKYVTAEQVRQDVQNDPDCDDFKYINSIELGVSWFHFDVRNCKRIKTYKPN